MAKARYKERWEGVGRDIVSKGECVGLLQLYIYCYVIAI